MVRPRKHIKKPLDGDLNKPIRLEALPVDTEKAKNVERSNIETYSNAWMHKRGLLYKHYGLNLDNLKHGEELAMCLAHDFVEGFRIEYKGKAGRKRSWGLEALSKLYFDVEREKAKRRRSVSSICEGLVKRDEWKAFLSSGNDSPSSQTLRNMHSIAKASLLAETYRHIQEQLEPGVALEIFGNMADNLFESLQKPSR